MASKRPNPKEDPPAASSEEESSTDEASSDEELPPQLRTLATNSQLQPKKPAVENSDSDSEYESDTDSDSDPPPPKSSGVLHNVNPIASKPQPKAPAPASSSKSTPATKRGSETDREAKDSKRQKEVADGDGKNEYTPRALFQRLWGENDEIAVLNGLIEFAEKEGADPLKDMAAFYDFIKKSVGVDVSLPQLKEKVTRLRKKFMNHAKGKNGLDKSFSRAHDQKTFDLSKMIWDSQGEGLLGPIANGKSSGKAKKSGGANGVGSSKSASKAADLGTANGHGNAKSATSAALGAGNEGAETMEVDGVNDRKDGLSFDLSSADAEVEAFVVNKGMDMVDGSKRNELARRWKELDIEALEHFVKRQQLILDQAQSILDSSGSG